MSQVGAGIFIASRRQELTSMHHKFKMSTTCATICYTEVRIVWFLHQMVLWNKAFRHHSHCVFKGLSFIAEPNPNNFSVVSKLMSKCCDFRTWNWNRFSLRTYILPVFLLADEQMTLLVSASYYFLSNNWFSSQHFTQRESEIINTWWMGVSLKMMI